MAKIKGWTKINNYTWYGKTGNVFTDYVSVFQDKEKVLSDNVNRWVFEQGFIRPNGDLVREMTGLFDTKQEALAYAMSSMRG